MKYFCNKKSLLSIVYFSLLYFHRLTMSEGTMSAEKLYIDKELSWLSFNERVLQEAADKTVPLIERVRFLGIFSNNLDEFYKVRFADVKRRILIAEDQGDGDEAKNLLAAMQAEAARLDEKFNDLYNELLLEMARPPHLSG